MLTPFVVLSTAKFNRCTIGGSQLKQGLCNGTGIPVRILKVHTDSELDPARIRGAIWLQERRINLVRSLPAGRLVHSVELCMVERVIALKPELAVDALSKLESTVQGDIPDVDSRTVQDVNA